MRLLADSLPKAMARASSYASGDVVAWAEQNFPIPDPARPIVLEPHQKALLRLVEARNPDGTHRYKTAVYSTPKKSGKTTIAALVARLRAETGGPFQEIYCVANDLEQAQGRVFQAARTSIQLTPSWQRRWKITERELIHIPSGSVIRAIPSDYKGEAGANPSLTTWTELWGYDSERCRRLWDELTPVPTRDSTRLVETYAGFEGESDLLWELYERGVLNGHQLNAWELHELAHVGLSYFQEAPNPDSIVPIWVDEAASLLVYWDSGEGARRMPWQRGEEAKAYYAEQEQSLRPKAFERLHLNRWVTAESSFVPIEWWDACREDLPPFEPDHCRDAVVLGVDAASTGDSFAVVAVTRHPQRHGDVAIRACRKWDPPKGGRIDYSGPEEFIRTVCQHYRVVQIAYDPHQLEDMMQRLYRERVAWCEPFPQGNDRLMADRRFYDLIVNRRLAHHGDPDMREHIQNANAKLQKDEDSTLRIVKKAPNRKIDLAVAASMACHRCLYLLL